MDVIVFAEVVLYSNVSLLRVWYKVDERKVETEFFAQRIVAEEYGIMDGFLQWFNLSRIEIAAHVATKRPHYGNVWVCVFQSGEVFMAYPSTLVVVLSVESIDEECRAHPVYVIYVNMLIFAYEQSRMAHGASSAEQIYEVGALR